MRYARLLTGGRICQGDALTYGASNASQKGNRGHARAKRTAVDIPQSDSAFLPLVLYTLPMDTKNHSVLLVEDEEPMRIALSGALEQAGYTVYTGSNGEEGLKAAVEKHPDLILTDLKMPKMGGLEMIRELRKDEWGKNAEVIILTNISDVTALEAAMSEGAFFYMVKSDSSMADVLEKVKSRLSK